MWFAIYCAQVVLTALERKEFTAKTDRNLVSNYHRFINASTYQEIAVNVLNIFPNKIFEK